MHSADCRSLRHLEATYPASHNCHAASPRPTRGCATHTSQARLSGTSHVFSRPSTSRVLLGSLLFGPQAGRAAWRGERWESTDTHTRLTRSRAQKVGAEGAARDCATSYTHGRLTCSGLLHSIVLYFLSMPRNTMHVVYTSQCTQHAVNLESRNRDEMLLIPDADRLGSPDTRVVAETRWWNGAAGTDSALVGTRIVARVLLTRACRLLLT